MKTVKLISIALAEALLVLSACKNDNGKEPDPESVFKVTPTELSFTKDGGNGLDTYGFAALPVDYGYTYFWSANPTVWSNGAYGVFLGYDGDYLFDDNGSMSNGRSVRCLRD